MKKRIVVLGAGFGGLELSTELSAALGDRIDLTLIDKSEYFVFGFSKFDLMFGLSKLDEVRTAYSRIKKPGLSFRRETVEAIDPTKRRVTTNRSTYDADVLVLALGADYDIRATPGIEEGGNEFYSIEGALRSHAALERFSGGDVVIGVSSIPFKCPPAPSEAALLLDDYLRGRGKRDKCKISLVMPFRYPIPPSPEASETLLQTFGERNIEFVAGRAVSKLDGARKVAILDDGREISCDIYFGVPKHKAPNVVASSGLVKEEDGWGWVPVVSSANLKTSYHNVYVIGDLASTDVPKAGMFAEGEARVVAKSIIADLEGAVTSHEYDGTGSCYIEFGSGMVGRVDMNFLSGPVPKGIFSVPSRDISKEKRQSASERIARWFGAG